MNNKESDDAVLPSLDDNGINEKPFADPDDPCNSYAWSILFLLVLIVAILVLLWECYAMFQRRQELLSGFDIGVLFFFVCTIIQFGPMMSQVLHAGHNVRSFSQSGCKLLHYTEYGIRHVILAIVLAWVIYAWLITKHNFNQEQVDKKVRLNLPWLIMLALGIEGIFGMPVAVYVDILPNFPDHCVWSPTMTLSAHQIMALEITLRPLLPYMIPALVLPWPLIELRRIWQSVEGSKLKSQIKSILIISWAYIAMNLPYSIIYLVHYASLWKASEDSASATAVCNFQWFFFLIHQCFFVLVPVLMIKHEITLGNAPPGTDQMLRLWDKFLSIWRTARDDRSELV